MDFPQALEYLFSANNLGPRPGLDRMTELMNRLGNPQDKLKVVHIAGTNGKGSSSSFCAHIGACQDLKVGWFTSPYLEHFNERIRIINGRQGLADFEHNFRSPEIPDQEFARLMTELREVIEAMEKDNFLMPTVFEMLTALAYLYFYREKVDLAVIEVGLGGRLDSTNIIKQSSVSIITALGLDHVDRLGDDLISIAREKAGIIKENCPVIVYDPRDASRDRVEGEQALEVIKDKAQEKNAPLYLVSKSDITYKPDRTEFEYKDQAYEIKLRGDHQKLNASLAIEAGQFFASPDAIVEGLKRTRWPGRLEVMRNHPLVLLDGAHNIQGCAALRREMDLLLSDEDIIYLVAVLSDKDHEDMLSLVVQEGQNRPDSVYCTEAPVPRTLSAYDLASEMARILERDQKAIHELELVTGSIAEAKENGIYYSSNMETALLAALEQAAHQAKPLVIFGSLYLIGNLRPILRRELWGDQE